MATKPPKTAEPVWPNEGVRVWYQNELQKFVTEMNDEVLAAVRKAYARTSPDIGFAASDAEPLLAAGVLFINPEGRVLLMRRTDGLGWAFPAGGVEHGETPVMCAAREAGEETGWAPKVADLSELRPADTRVWRNVIFHTFVVHTPGFIPVKNSEHDSHRWEFPRVALAEMYGDLHPGVRRTLQAMADGHLAYDAAPFSLLRKALEKWGGLWIKKLDRLSLSLSAAFASKSTRATQAAMMASFKKAGFTIAFKPTAGSAAAYEAVVAENVNLIKSIPQQYLKDVQSQVWASVMKGGDLAQLTKGIQQKYGIAFRRAALIARDQNSKAKAIMENVRRQELGITKAIWMHSHAGKEPRPSHVKMNGKPYALAKGMWDKDEGEYVWPGQLINCRCTSRAIIPGFE
jgi:8-oxo-dGTP pyrophosphatase MutT (NUDIX family)